MDSLIPGQSPDKGDGTAGADDLVARASADAQAVGALFDKYYERILSYCAHRLGNRWDAEDITSETFLRVARHVGTFQGGDAEFRRWLYAIATNQINGYMRTAARRRQLLAAALEQGAAGQGDHTDPPDDPETDWPSLYEAILRLRPNHQVAVTLRFFEGMAIGELSGILDMKPAAVRVTLSRALGKLRKHLGSAFSNEAEI